jgi:hypothetical protein
LNSRKSEKTDAPTISTSIQQRSSMIASTSKEIPTVVYNSYSEIRPSESLSSVLTTVSPSPKQSSMLAAGRTRMSSISRAPSYPAGSNSPEIAFSTPVSEEMSRLSSSMSVQPTNSLTQITTKSYIGISSYRSSSRAVSRTGLASSAETNAPASSTRRTSSRNQEVSRSPTTFAETGATPDMPSSSKGVIL